MALSAARALAIVSCILTLLLQHENSYGQYHSGAVGLVNTGYISTRHSTPVINSELAEGLHFENGYTLIGVEGYYCHRRAIVGVSGNLGFQDAVLEKSDLVEPFVWTAHTAFGWVVSRSRKFMLYPAVGIGATGVTVSRYRSASRDIDDTGAVAPSIDAGLRFDYLLTDPATTDKVTNGVVFGVRIGYNRSLSAVSWMNENNVRGRIFPSQLQGWYFTISVGGLAFMKEK